MGCWRLLLRVSLDVGEGSTVEASDYTLTPLTARIAAGQLTATFRWDALRDEHYEGNEQLVLVPRASGVGLDDIVGEQGIFTIVEEGVAPVLSFDQIPDLDEGDSRIITVRLSGTFGDTVTVSFAVEQQTTAMSPADYELVPPSFDIPSGSLTATFNLNTKRTPGVEGDKILVLKLTNNRGLEVEVPALLALRIREVDVDTVPTISLDPIPDVKEGESVDGAVRLTGPLQELLNIELPIGW